MKKGIDTLRRSTPNRAISRKSASKTCANCDFVEKTATAHICYRNPPMAVVVNDQPVTMRVSVQPTDRACGEFKAR